MIKVGSKTFVQMHRKCNFLLCKCASVYTRCNSSQFALCHNSSTLYCPNPFVLLSESAWSMLEIEQKKSELLATRHVEPHPVKTALIIILSIYFWLDCIGPLMSNVNTVLACTLMIIHFRTLRGNLGVTN